MSLTALSISSFQLVDNPRRPTLVPSSSLGISFHDSSRVSFSLSISCFELSPPSKALTDTCGHFYFVYSFTDKEKWVKALSLDLETGLDPPGQKVRAAQGQFSSQLGFPSTSS